MTEVIRYSRLGEEDCRFGKGTFEVRLADGRVVTMSEIDVGAILTDSELSTQAVTLSTLVLSGGQLAFPAAQNASTNANTLDDYEEGTWTPNVGGTATYTTQAGTYTKIGRVIFFNGQLIINVIGTGSTSTIEGLPFTAAARAALTVADTADLAIPVVSIAAWISTSTATIFLGARTAASIFENTTLVLGSGTSITVSGFYVV